MNAASIITYSIQDLVQALNDLIENQFRPTVAIGFSSPDFPYVEAAEIFKEYTIALVGCTSSGEVYDDSIQQDSFSVLLFDLPPTWFRTISFDHEDIGAYSSGAKLSALAKETFPNPGVILFISGVRVVGDGPVEGLRENINREIPIYGGLAGDNLQHDATYTFTHQGIRNFGVAALIIDTTKVQVKGLAVSGWKPMGRTHTVTRADQNVIYEIDDKPALDLFLNYFGNIEYKLSNQEGSYSIPGQYPLQVLQEDGSSFLRSLLIYDKENRSLMAAGKIKTGDNFRFCPPPDMTVLQDTVMAFEKFNEEVQSADALVMISCKGRHTSFGPLLDDEVKAIHKIWEAPMVGFLSNGEIGNTLVNGKCEFHNVTCSLVSLKQI